MLKNPIYTGRVTNKKSEVTDFITGAAPNYTLNLTIPQGPTGPAGAGG